jgi:hypothetical protein
VADRMRVRSAASAVLVAVMVALVVTGCGGKAAPTTTTPSPTASKGGLAGTIGALKTYLEQVKPITAQVGAAAASLPDAVKGLKVKPDSTWTQSAAKLNAIASQLAGAGSSLAALTPPASLQSVQAAGVKGIQDAQSAVTGMADALGRRSASAATRKAEIQAQIGSLQAQLSGLSKMLGAATGL